MISLFTQKGCMLCDAERRKYSQYCNPCHELNQMAYSISMFVAQTFSHAAEYVINMREENGEHWFRFNRDKVLSAFEKDQKTHQEELLNVKRRALVKILGEKNGSSD